MISLTDCLFEELCLLLAITLLSGYIYCARTGRSMDWFLNLELLRNLSNRLTWIVPRTPPSTAVHRSSKILDELSIGQSEATESVDFTSSDPPKKITSCSGCPTKPCVLKKLTKPPSVVTEQLPSNEYPNTSPPPAEKHSSLKPGSATKMSIPSISRPPAHSIQIKPPSERSFPTEQVPEHEDGPSDPSETPDKAVSIKIKPPSENSDLLKAVSGSETAKTPESSIEMKPPGQILHLEPIYSEPPSDSPSVVPKVPDDTSAPIPMESTCICTASPCPKETSKVSCPVHPTPKVPDPLCNCCPYHRLKQSPEPLPVSTESKSAQKSEAESSCICIATPCPKHGTKFSEPISFSETKQTHSEPGINPTEPISDDTKPKQPPTEATVVPEVTLEAEHTPSEKAPPEEDSDGTMTELKSSEAKSVDEVTEEQTNPESEAQETAPTDTQPVSSEPVDAKSDSANATSTEPIAKAPGNS